MRSDRPDARRGHARVSTTSAAAVATAKRQREDERAGAADLEPVVARGEQPGRGDEADGQRPRPPSPRAAKKTPAAAVRAAAAGWGWAGSVAGSSEGTGAWSVASIDGGSADQGPCAASPVRGGGATVSGTERLSQPLARGSMTARAVLCADTFCPKGQKRLLRSLYRCCRPRARRAAARGISTPRQRSGNGPESGPRTRARRSSRRPRRSSSYSPASTSPNDARPSASVVAVGEHPAVGASQLDRDAAAGPPAHRVQHVRRQAHSASSSRRRAILAISPSAVSISCSRRVAQPRVGVGEDRVRRRVLAHADHERDAELLAVGARWWS